MNHASTGDYDGDDDVDLDDYEEWISSFGQTGLDLAADGNGDGKISAADYTVWRDHLGATLGAGNGSGSTIPEPGTLALGTIAAFALVCSAVRQRGT